MDDGSTPSGAATKSLPTVAAPPGAALIRLGNQRWSLAPGAQLSFGRGQDYVSLMTDLSGRRVLDVVPGRERASALELWSRLPAAQRDRVEAVAIDMSPEFTAAAKQSARHAVIVYDKFHVAKHLNEAVDKVRREEHRRLLQQGDKSLTGTKYLWLQGACAEGERALNFAQLCAVSYTHLTLPTNREV